MESFYIIAFGMILGIIVVFSVDLMLWSLFVLSMFLIGVAVMISPSLGSLKWAIAMISVIMLIVVISRLMLGKTTDIGRKHISLTLIYIFVVFTIISAGVNFYPKEWVTAAKNYFQFWSIPLIYYYILKNEKTPTRITVAMLILASIEPLIVAIQYFYLRGGTFIGDRIAGTFGAGIGVIGGNDSLAMFQITQMFIVFALIKNKLIKLRTGIFLSMWFLLPIFVTSTKAVVIMIPLGIITLFFKEMRTRMTVFLSVTIIAFGFSALMALVYFSTSGNYVTNSKYAPKTFDQFLDQSIKYNVDSNKPNDLNRTTALLYWWDQNGTEHLWATLFGHGLGAAKNTGQAFGHLYYEPRYQNINLGATFMARLLWEVGLVGSAIYIGIFYTLFVLAGRLASNLSIPLFHRAILSGYKPTILIFIISIPYKITLISTQGFSAYSMFVAGYVLFWYRYQKQIKLNNKVEQMKSTLVLESSKCLHIVK